jgi:hypothetical protein
MTIEHRIHHDRRLVWARALGTLTDQEVFTYQLEVWSQPEVAGFHELIDMSAVERVAVLSADRIRQLASLAAAMDARTTESKLAIVAPNDFEFGLGRTYETYRELESESRKEPRVFRSVAEALRWLGIEAKADDGLAARPFNRPES